VIYEAPQLPTCRPRIDHVALGDLPRTALTTAATLFVPPRERKSADPAMVARLGLDARSFGLEPTP
jgi:hypothetical protein